MSIENYMYEIFCFSVFSKKNNSANFIISSDNNSNKKKTQSPPEIPSNKCTIFFFNTMNVLIFLIV